MRTFILCIGMLLVGYTMTFAQIIVDGALEQPESFRSQALGGVIDDDLDLVYDPIELRFVKGIRIYTNLSNLLTSNEKILNESSYYDHGCTQNELFFGVSMKNPLFRNVWSSVLIRYQNFKYSNPLYFYTSIPNSPSVTDKWGYYHQIYTLYADEGEYKDGLYDTKYVFDWDETNFSWNKTNGLVINHTWKPSVWTLGFRYATAKMYIDSTLCSSDYLTDVDEAFLIGYPSFGMHYQRYDVDSNVKQYERIEDGNFLWWRESRYHSYHFSAMRPFYWQGWTPIEMRGDFVYVREYWSEQHDDVYAGQTYYYNPDISEYDNHLAMDESSDYLEEVRGHTIYLAVSAKRVFKQATERRNNGFWEVGVGLMDGSFDYDHTYAVQGTSDERYFDGLQSGDLDDRTDMEGSISITDRGPGDKNGWFGWGRVNVPLGKKVYTGMGLYIGTSKTIRNTNYTYHYDGSEVYDILGGANDKDYVGTAMEYWDADRRYELNYYYFILPVGIEYRFTNNNKWCLRFGSIYSYSRYNENDSKQMEVDQPYQETIVYNGGTEYVNVSDNEYESTSSQEKWGMSQTVFVYGLGFEPTEHFQIDLLGFLGGSDNIFDADFFRMLRISLTLKL
jgi:hypothetical protein